MTEEASLACIFRFGVLDTIGASILAFFDTILGLQFQFGLCSHPETPAGLLFYRNFGALFYSRVLAEPQRRGHPGAAVWGVTVAV
jgi:hypothetical protein